MDYLWIPIAVAAAFFQAVRLAALKRLNQHVSTTVATFVRTIYGLPILALYLALVLGQGGAWLPLSVPFLLYCAGTAISQFVGTALLVYLFQLGNFAVGTMLARTDVVITALLGALVFAEPVTGGGLFAIALTVAGVLIVSAARLGPAALASDGGQGLLRRVAALASRPTRIGLLAGLCLALSYLCLRQSILVLDHGTPLERSAWSAVVTGVLQLVLVGAWVLWREPRGLEPLKAAQGLCLFVGLASALGTICWFLASSLAKAAYVAAVAQVQIVFTLTLSWLYFRERILAQELAGIAVILSGVLLFRFV